MTPLHSTDLGGEPVLVARARQFEARTALVDGARSLTYGQLLEQSARAAARLLDGRADLHGDRVAFLVPPSLEYVVTQWAIWRAGGVAVPLCVTHPPAELAHVLDDSQAGRVVVHPSLSAMVADLAAERGLSLLEVGELDAPGGMLPALHAERPAMLLYTSGTTGKPKGVVSTHGMIAVQTWSVARAWQWSPCDRVLHTLPLHHLHGVLPALGAALYSGACCELLPRFDPERVWQRLEASDGLTLFMGVPTMYAKLLQHHDAADPERRLRMRAGCRRLRLMVSGSAALPATVRERFAELSGHVLLERYGMTEFGMGLGNPLHGERRPGHVGEPFPGVEVRLVDDAGREVEDTVAGHLQVRGPGVFRAYFRRPRETAESFTRDGWFKTGDVAVRDAGAFRILGRASTDVLKTGGYKVSALEIEDSLREHPAIAECAVVGVDDTEWGQRVAAAVVLHEGRSLDLPELRAFCKQHLAPYKAPSLLRVLPALPRNAMGKVQKRELVQSFA